MKDAIKLKVIEASMYFRDPLPDETVRLYARELEDLPVDQVLSAFDNIKKDPKFRKVPLPSEIRAVVQPEISDQDRGRLIASSIIEAVAKDGWTNSERAQKRIGEAGWMVVQRMGGWLNLCEELTNHNLPTMQAQMRDLATTLIQASRSGALNPQALPEPRRKTQVEQQPMKSLGDILSGALQNRTDGEEGPRMASHLEKAR